MKRLLTQDEIEDIVSFIPYVKGQEDESPLSSCNHRIRLDLITQLKPLMVYPQCIPLLKKECINTYKKSQIQPGTCVGGDASLAIGEPTTQMTLNTGHAVGAAANVTQGVPRFNEILNATTLQKTNMIKCRLADHVLSQEDRKKLSVVRDISIPVIEERYIEDIVHIKKGLYPLQVDYKPEIKEDWYESFVAFCGDHFSHLDWRIRIVLNKEEIYKHKLSPELVADIIEERYGDTRCVFSTMDECIVDVYVDTSNVESIEVILKSKKGEKETIINEDNKDFYFVHRVVIPYLLDIQVSGIKGIQKIWFSKNTQNNHIGGSSIENEWIMDCKGTNLRELMNNEMIDHTTVISNNMREIFDILGIEAARKFIINEIKSIISFGGTYIDPVHYTLLVDAMTNGGYITGVNIYGMVKSIVGVLTPASFEQSHKNILDAPAKGITDNLSTVSAQIIMGKHIRMGTGYFDIHVDTKKLMNESVFKTQHVTEHTFIEPIESLEQALKDLHIKRNERQNKEEEEDVY